MRIFVAQINPIVGDIYGNTQKILTGIAEAKKKRAELIIFPELCLSGYPPEDFLLLNQFIKSIDDALQEIIRATVAIAAIVGLPRKNPSEISEKGLLNSAAIIENQKLLGFQDKTLLPTYDVFDERRYFDSAEHRKLWTLCGTKIAVTICEDIWQNAKLLNDTKYIIDPIKEYQDLKPQLLINIAASPYSINKYSIRLDVCRSAAKSLGCPLIFCNQVGGNDSLIFDGYSLFMDPEGTMQSCAKGFQEDEIFIDTNQKSIVRSFTPDKIKDLHDALVLGLKDYFQKSGFKKACFGLSGGIDSAVVACIAQEALGKENVMGVMMPSRYSSEHSITDSEKLAGNLGISTNMISIEPAFQTFLEMLSPHFSGTQPDSTEENLQARIRGMILMSLSNKFGYIVLSTGNKSELAMGYATLYGDMCGGLGVISDVSKRYVYELAEWINRENEIIPKNIILKPPSAELKPDQKDADSLPPYDVIDSILDAYILQHKDVKQIADENLSFESVSNVIHQIHKNEYKRRQSPPGLRVTEKAFTFGRRFPIVQRWVK